MADKTPDRRRPLMSMMLLSSSSQRNNYRIGVMLALFGSSVLFLISQRKFLHQFHYNPLKESEAVPQQLVVVDKKPLRLNSTNKTSATTIAAVRKTGSVSKSKNTPHVMMHNNNNHMHHHHHFNHHSNQTEAFCLQWNSNDATNRTHLQPFDIWWTHHPTYIIANETDDTFCVEPSDDIDRNEAFQKFYHTQFETGCSEIHWRVMWSSGWGADMMNVQVR